MKRSRIKTYMTNADMHLNAGRAITDLSQRLKTVGQQHRERIKKLKKLSHALETAPKKRDGQGELIELTVSLAPEDIDLLNAPLAGL